MKFTAKQYAQALFDSLESTHGKDHDLVLDNFVAILAANNDLKLFPEISDEFHKFELKKRDIQLVEVTSARTLSKENEHQIIEKLNTIVKGNVELKKKIDEKLIGGVVIRMEDQVIDVSTKNTLEQLKNNLTE
jgi:F-type H+-transporting ATPase subunit delta